MDYPINRAVVLKLGSGTLNSVTVNYVGNQQLGAVIGAGTSFPSFYLGPNGPLLEICDGTSIAVPGLVIWFAALSDLARMVGQTQQVNYAYSNGLAIPSFPPGLAITVSYS